ncbi:phosphohydrolase [Bradyrhizobium ontarionense]|uniref:Phosphohydrolase n=1 Tax=Bradyrhizobium ontarionense TaxID=2898149 RepID=A0ABY3RF53_9BRAD|nr:phosphohydrolase [Bradyrhizobium sp. A19]UFZ06084.1 phosphohydrolase [Bradyrhizobium sp. A19]
MTHDDLVAAYSATGRHYHDLRHIEDCLAWLDRVAGLGARDREILTLAIWWHDVVYDPTQSDNEEQSAVLAERDVAPELRGEVGRLIRLTRTHDVAPGDRLGALLVSIDLAILGADDVTYDAYANAIRREYAHVPDDAYRAGRAAVLERFANRRVIYPDADFAAALDQTARANLARELRALRSVRG